MMRAPHVSIVRKNPISKCGENRINYSAGARWYDMRRNIVHLKIFKSVISKSVARAIIIIDCKSYNIPEETELLAEFPMGIVAMTVMAVLRLRVHLTGRMV